MEPSGAVRLVTVDGVRLAGVHHAGADRSLALVVAHGFTGAVTRPRLGNILAGLGRHAGVLAVDFRGHGGSGGSSTAGATEVHDVEAAVSEARRLGYRRVATVGFSMGGSVVLRHAALAGGVDAVVSVSAPARWFVRETRAMRRVHWLNETVLGRAVCRRLMHTRLGGAWESVPESPVELVGRIAPVPLLIVHGDADSYFPIEHPRALVAATGGAAELWLIGGMGHAESAMTPVLVGRIARWVRVATLRQAADLV